MKNGLKKGIAITTASLVGLTGLVGVLHMPFARSFLMKVGGCPVVRSSPAQIEEAQNAAATRSAADATSSAPTKPALGFVLEKTTPADVHSWISDKGLKCTDDLDGTVISCLRVPASVVGQQGPELAELQFDFHAEPKTLRIVSTFRSHMSREDTLTVMQARDEELTRALGAPNQVAGQPSLQSGPASAAYIVSYNFKDYMANEQATELGSGFALAEHFVSQSSAQRSN